jgi:hypothetical protein
VFSETGPVQFPDFVLCLEAPWDVNKSKQLNISIDLLSYMTNLFYPYGGFGMNGNSLDNLTITQLDTEYRQLLNSTGMNIIRLLDHITVSCEQLIDGCIFGYSQLFDRKSCCLLLFDDPEYGMGGKCFRTHNKNMNFSLKESSARSGLNIKFTVNENVLDGLNQNIVNYPGSMLNGVSFAATNRQSHLYTIISKVKSLIPNSFNAISLKKTTVDRSKKDSPFGPYSCVGDDDFYSYSRLTPGYSKYTREHCIVAEKQKSVVNTFNCSLIYFTPIPETEYCGPTETTYIYFKR